MVKRRLLTMSLVISGLVALVQALSPVSVRAGGTPLVDVRAWLYDAQNTYDRSDDDLLDPEGSIWPYYTETADATQGESNPLRLNSGNRIWDVYSDASTLYRLVFQFQVNVADLKYDCDAEGAAYWFVQNSNGYWASTDAAGTKELLSSDRVANDDVTDASGAASTALDYRIAQSFVAQSQVVAGQIYGRKTPGASASAVLRIETDDSGEPSGTLVSSDAIDTLSASCWPTSNGWVTFSFDSTVPLQSSTTYHIILKDDHTDNAENITICDETDGQQNQEIASDGYHGAIVTWADYRSGKAHIYAQRVDSLANTLWTTDGIVVCQGPQSEENPAIVSDGYHGAIITWIDYRNGTYDIYAQRVDSLGNTKWTDNGVLICQAAGDQVYVELASDGYHGAIIVWRDYRNGGTPDIYAQRVDSSGNAVWTANGVAICTAANSQLYPKLVSDGHHGAIITWDDWRTGNYDVYAQRVDSLGNTKWTADGTVVCDATGGQVYAKIVSDGYHGAVIAWQDARNGMYPDIYAQRVDSLGNGMWPADWWNSSWQYRRKLTFDNSGQSKHLENFPVLVSLSSSNFDYSKAKSDGTDLRFIDDDGTTELKYHIEEWNSSGTSYIWVKVTQVDSASTTDFIQMYYGNTGASNIQDTSGTYDANFVAVWHLNESGSGIADEYRDCSGSGNHGQGGSGTAGYVPTQAAGKISYGQDFDGVDDHINCGSDTSLDRSGYQITLEAWIRYPGPDPSHYVGYLSNSGWSNGYRMVIKTNTYKVRFQNPEQTYDLATSQDVSVDTFHYVAATYDSAKMRIYVDGSKDSAELTKTDSLLPTGQEIWIGHGDDAVGQSWSYPWEGSIDEVRISNIARSGDWIKAQYLSMTDAFITYGAEIGQDGVPICTASGNQYVPEIVSDDYHGAVITWEDDRNATWDVYAQRVDSLGNMLWTTDGVAVCDANYRQDDMRIAADGYHGAIIAWRDNRNGTDYNIYAGRVDSLGTTPWTSNGVLVCGQSNAQEDPRIVSDDHHGAFIVWRDQRSGTEDIYLEGVDSLGNVRWNQGIFRWAYEPADYADGEMMERSSASAPWLHHTDKDLLFKFPAWLVTDWNDDWWPDPKDTSDWDTPDFANDITKIDTDDRLECVDATRDWETDAYDGVAILHGGTLETLQWEIYLKVDEDWSDNDTACVQLHMDAAGGGHTTDILFKLHTTNPKLKWMYPGADSPAISTGVRSSPVIRGGRVYFTDMGTNKKLYSLGASDGSLNWTYTANSLIYTSPSAVYEDPSWTIYFADDGGWVYAIKDAGMNPLEKWKVQATPGSSIRCSPIIRDSLLYVGSYDDSLHCLRTSDGSQKWATYVSDFVNFSAASVFNNVVYIGSYADTLYALNATDGTILRRYGVCGNINSPTFLTWSNGLVCIGSCASVTPGSDTLYVINSSNFDTYWKFSDSGNLASMNTSCFSLDDQNVYFGNDNDYLYCIDISDSSLVYKYQTGNDVNSSPLLLNGVVYFGSDDNKFYALDDNTQQPVAGWPFVSNGPIESSPAISLDEGIVVVGGRDGHVYAFNLE